MQQQDSSIHFTFSGAHLYFGQSAFFMHQRKRFVTPTTPREKERKIIKI
jgi:hypothetical protein